MTAVTATEFAKGFGRYKEAAQLRSVPPKLFERLIAKFRELRAQGKVAGVSRDEPIQAVPAKSLPGSKK